MIASASDSGRVFSAIWKLLRLRVRLNVNSFLHSKLRVKILMILGLLGLLGLAALIFFGSWGLLGLLRSPQFAQHSPVNVQPLMQLVPVMLLSGLFIGILFTSFGVLLQALYLAGDMDFLLASPVPIRAVFVTKMLQAVLPNFGLFALFGLPLLYGLGLSAGYNILFYPLVLLVMIAMALAAAGISSLLVMAVVRILPPRRAAEILGFIGATVGVLCGQSGNFSRFFAQDVNPTPAQLGSATSLITRFTTLWIPLNWAGHGLVDLGEGRWLSGIVLVVLTLGLASAAFWFALETAERLYYTGWAGMQVVARKKPARARRQAAVSETSASRWFERLLPGPIRAIFAKDFLMFGRDLRHMAQLISPMIVGVMFTFMLVRSGGEPPPGQGDAPAWFMDAFRLVLAYGNIGIALFVSWILLSRLAGMGFSQEGKNFWMLKASPVSARQMLAAKFLVAYLPSAAVGLVFVIAVGLLRGLSFGQVLFMLPVILLCVAGLDGILLSLGAAGANFKWEDPRRMNAGGLGCLGQIVTLVFMPIGLALFIGPVLLVVALQLPQLYGYAGGLVLGGIVSLICAFLPLRLSERTVQRLDES